MSTSPASIAAVSTTAVLDITGMTCASCVRHVERALRAVDGVADASVNLATAQATVVFDAQRTPHDAITAAVAAAGYGARAAAQDPAAGAGAVAPAAGDADRAERRAALRDLAIAAIASAPVLVLGMAHGAIAFADTFGGRVVQGVLATLVLFGPGRRFLRGGLAAARARRADMNTLVALGATAAWGWSVVATFAPGWFVAPHGPVHAAPHVYFEATAAIVTFVLAGKFLEARARWRLGDALRGLHALVPAMAHRVDVDGANEREVAVATLRVGDHVRVRPGERVPSDGLVVRGEAAVDESLLTGESVPVARAVGQRVSGGSMVGNGALEVRIDRTGADTAIARIAAAVREAQGSRAPIASFADRVSAVFVPVVLGLALATLASWWALAPSAAGFAVAIERAVAVLVIACPCALGLATPAAVAVGAARGAQLGVLFRNGAALEAASHVDAVVFDKTGTLTNGRPELVALDPVDGVTVDELLRAAAAVEVGSEHPFARAIVAAARARMLALPAADAFQATVAMGAAARVDGEVVRVGKPAWLQQHGIDVHGVARHLAAATARGASPLLVARGERVLGVLGLADGVRDDAAPALAALATLGVHTAMASGDHAAVATAVARQLRIDDVAAELLPAAKVERIHALRAAGHRVAMVGDGVNDAPALAAADVGMAVGTGTDIAAAAADVALLRGGLTAVPVALALARATMRTIRRNLVWASLYNLLGLPVAAGAFAFAGVTLSPVIASAAMALSSVSVLASSLWLRRFTPGPILGAP